MIMYKTSWGRPQYEVLGSTATYAVFPGLPSPGGYKLAYCTCPAYAYSVLLSETQIMVRAMNMGLASLTKVRTVQTRPGDAPRATSVAVHRAAGERRRARVDPRTTM